MQAMVKDTEAETPVKPKPGRGAIVSLTKTETVKGKLRSDGGRWYIQGKEGPTYLTSDQLKELTEVAPPEPPVGSLQGDGFHVYKRMDNGWAKLRPGPADHTWEEIHKDTGRYKVTPDYTVLAGNMAQRPCEVTCHGTPGLSTDLSLQFKSVDGVVQVRAYGQGPWRQVSSWQARQLAMQILRATGGL